MLFSALASAQTAMQPAANDQSELKNFQALIQQHPKALAELKKNPSALGTPQFASRYRRVGQYVQEHRKVVDQVKANPKCFDGLTATSAGGKNHVF
jgi:hypothetical protein